MKRVKFLSPFYIKQKMFKNNLKRFTLISHHSPSVSKAPRWFFVNDQNIYRKLMLISQSPSQPWLCISFIFGVKVLNFIIFIVKDGVVPTCYHKNISNYCFKNEEKTKHCCLYLKITFLISSLETKYGKTNRSDRK